MPVLRPGRQRAELTFGSEYGDWRLQCRTEACAFMFGQHLFLVPVALCPSLGVGVDFLRPMTHDCVQGSLDKEAKLCVVVTASHVTFSSRRKEQSCL